MPLRRWSHTTALLAIWFWHALSSSVSAQTRQQCIESDLALCVYNQVVGDSVRLFAKNRRNFDLTVEVELTLLNMRSEHHSTMVFVVGANSDQSLTTLKPIEIGRPSNFSYRYTSIQGNINAIHNDTTVYQLPFAEGSTFYVGQSCDTQGTHQADHVKYAIDFSLPIGTPVHAIRGGKVIDLYELSNSGGVSAMHVDKGNFVQIEHADGTISSYHHLRIMGVKVSIGDSVDTGDFIAYSGNTGYSSGPHLHVSVQKPASPTRIASIPIMWQTARGLLRCPRAGLALKSIAVMPSNAKAIQHLNP